MSLNIVWQDRFLVVGIRHAGRHPETEIPALWRTLLPRADEIRAAPACRDRFYGVFLADGDDGLEYVAGRVALAWDAIPDGMAGWEVPSGHYAMFETRSADERGRLRRRRPGETVLENKDYEILPNPAFEICTTPDPADPAAVVLVHLPVRRRADVSAFDRWMDTVHGGLGD